MQNDGISSCHYLLSLHFPDSERNLTLLIFLYSTVPVALLPTTSPTHSTVPVALLTTTSPVLPQNHNTRTVADILARTGLQKVMSAC